MIITGGQAFVKAPASSVFQEGEEKKMILLKGQVYKKEGTSKTQILYLKNNSISYKNRSFYESRILIYDETCQNIAIGETVTLKGNAEPFERARNPGNFDAAIYYAKQGIYGSVWSKEILKVEGKKNIFREELYQMKISWKMFLVEGAGEKSGAVLSAMLLSEKSEMDTEVKELYQKNGIGHILAISGLHISFIGLGIYRLIRKAGCSYPVAGLVSILLLSTYVMLIGFSVSVIRAYIMLCIRIGADMSGRVYDMATSLFLSGTLIIIRQPLYLMDAGFLMSYGAILGILVILPAMERLVPCRWKIFTGLYAGISINLILFPVLLYFYFEFPIYSFLFNMVVIPMMTWILGFGMSGSALGFLWKPAGVVLLRGCHYILEFFEGLSRLGSALPGSRMVFGQPFWWQIIVYYSVLFGSIWYIYKQKEKERTSRWKWCICIVYMALIFLFSCGHRTNGEISVTFVDVGQGDSIFVRGPQGNTYLVDGGSSDVSQVGKYRLEPFLKSQGVSSLDYVFVSHGDLDHYSGIEEMIVRQKLGVRIQCLVLPVTYAQDESLLGLAALAKNHGVKVVTIEGGRSLAEGRFTITCIQPDRQFEGDVGNESSMVLAFQFGEFDMLCTGDVEAKGEELLLQNLDGKQYDVLKVAHHGSQNSTAEELLQIVKPKIAVISVGEKNRYGHPHKETVERIERIGSDIYNTAKNGAVTMKSNGRKLQIKLWIDGFH